MSQAQPAPDCPSESPRRVPFFDASASFEASWPDIRSTLDRALDQAAGGRGPMARSLEERIGEYTGAGHAIACKNGTDALILLLRSCGVTPGDEVIVPCYSFIASASSIAALRAKPVFVDIAPGGFAIDPLAIGPAVTQRTKAVMPVHLFHQMANMTEICRIAEETGITVIEDSAQAIGMRHGHVHAGLLGRGGALSFFPTKVLGAIGDAGMILTNDDEIAETARALCRQGFAERDGSHPRDDRDEAVVWGCSSKLDDIQAAVLLARLDRLARDIEQRDRIAARYSRNLSDLSDQITLPCARTCAPGTRLTYSSYVILAERKKELASYLAEHGVETREYYQTPLHLQPCFAYLGHKLGDFPVAEQVCKQAIAMPIYPDLDLESVDRICDLIHRFHRGKKPDDLVLAPSFR